MATTSLWAVKGWLGQVVAYAENPAKTSNPEFLRNTKPSSEMQGLLNVLEYAAKNEKTSKRHFVTGINCSHLTARMEMLEVKKRFGKEGGRVAFHGYQSFAPGEATPSVAHEIGVKLAERLWGKNFQVLVATHLDKENHLHTHFVLNSVSFKDGRRFVNSPKDYTRMREESDRLCEEYGLSVIKLPQMGKTKQYAEWQSEKQGHTTWRSLVKTDVDRAIKESMTEREFFARLKKQGYDFKTGKDISVRPPGKERFVRLKRNFGDSYTIEEIRKRILAQDEPARPGPPAKQKKSAHRHLSMHKPARRKISGVRGLYLHYQYILGIRPKNSPVRNARMHFLLREDLSKLDSLFSEMKLLRENKIETAGQLATHKESLISKIAELSEHRDCLRLELRHKDAATFKNEMREKITGLTAEIKHARKEVRKCEAIAERSGVIKEKINLLSQEKQTPEKEDKDNGLFRGSR